MALSNVREPCSALGAEILDVDLSTSLDNETIEFLRREFDDRGLLLFRDVEIDRATQYYLSVILMGHQPPTPEEAERGGALQKSFTISNKEPEAAAPFGRLLFHCDGMWSGEPFEVLSLYGVEVGEPVVPTTFANAAHAWEALPDDLRARVAGLHAEHVTGPEYIHERRRKQFGDELSQGHRDVQPTSILPVAYQHPRTGRTLLLVMQGMTNEIVELDSDASEDLLEELFAYLYAPENVYDHQWRKGDLILWDNFAIQHGRRNVTTEGPARTFQKIGLPMPADAQKHIIANYERLDSSHSRSG
jgi:alpha-ketoglutarate-dependent taurine dioxygenase